jgi:hypothetical protein
MNPMDTRDQYTPPEEILSDVLTAMCHAVTCAIELIPPDNPESRRMACAYAVKEIVASVEQMISRANATAH